MVSEAIFPTNRGYICIEKWSQIFVSGIGSAHSESEEKSLLKLKNIYPDFPTCIVFPEKYLGGKHNVKFFTVACKFGSPFN